MQKVQPGDEFILKYTHSVTLTPVWEIFIIDKNYQIVLIETDFLDHGAGLPYTTFNEEIFVEEEGRFKIKKLWLKMLKMKIKKLMFRNLWNNMIRNQELEDLSVSRL
ncbi:hypothetical protein ES708_32721 [subsurface metagenome]